MNKMKIKEDFYVVSNILEILSSPLEEVQAWAIIHSILSQIQTERNNISKETHNSCECCSSIGVKSYANVFSELWNYTLPTLNTICLCNKGHINILPESFIQINICGDLQDGNNKANTIHNLEHNPQDLTSQTSGQISKWLEQLGYSIFDALDQGLQGEEERCLQQVTSQMIELLSSAAPCCDDEGIEEETSDDEIITKVLGLCANQVFDTSNQPCPSLHFQAVLRALFSQVSELQTFLARIQPNPSWHADTDSVTGEDDSSSRHLESLGRRDWARVWMQVMLEMRCKAGQYMKQQGSTSSSRLIPQSSHHREYHLTPYEMLMVEIRAKKVQLKKVRTPPLSPHLRLTAENTIMEFIRSRPPLKNATERKLKEKPLSPPSARDLLLSDIRKQNYSLSPLPTSPNLSCDNGSSFMRSGSQRKLIRPNPELFNIFNRLSVSSDIEEDNPSPIDWNEGPVFTKSEESLVFDSPTDTNTADKPDNNISSHEEIHSDQKNISEQWLDPGEEDQSQLEQHFSADIVDLDTPTHFPFSSDFSDTPQMRRPLRVVAPSHNSINFENNKRRSSLGLSDEWSLDGDMGNTDEHQIRNMNLMCRRLSVRLNISEVAHIRKALTTAEMESRVPDEELYTKLKQEKLCFVCRTSRFTIFSWGRRCEMCSKRICKNCLTKASIAAGLMSDINIESLTPTGSKVKRNQSFNGVPSKSCKEQSSSSRDVCIPCVLTLEDFVH